MNYNKKHLPLKKVTSIGAVIINKDKRVLIVFQKENRYWELPKGKIERTDKNEMATLKRELFEETRLKDFKIVKGFRHEIVYNFTFQGHYIRKTNIYYMAYTDKAEVKLSDEHTDFKWVSLAAVNRYFKHKSQRILIYKVREFLGEKISYGSQMASR